MTIAILCHSTDKPAGETIAQLLNEGHRSARDVREANFARQAAYHKAFMASAGGPAEKSAAATAAGKAAYAACFMEARVFDETTAYEATGATMTILVLSVDAFVDDAIRAVAMVAHEGDALRIFPWRAIDLTGEFGLTVLSEEHRFVGAHLHPRSGRWVESHGDLALDAEAMAVAVRGEVIRAIAAL